MTSPDSTSIPCSPVTRHRPLGALAAVLCLLACMVYAPSDARAQDLSPPPDLPSEATDGINEADDGGFGATLGADATFGKLGEDWFLNLVVQFVFSVDKLSVGIQAPLRLRVIDEDPQDEGVIREEDWDEVSDYFKIIRFVQWAQPGDVFYARIGELDGATIGHGTIVRDYLNVVDIDHFQLGLDTEVNTAWGGGEIMLDNLADPDIFGIRLYARPIAFVNKDSYFANWSVGTSFVADFQAPSQIQVESTATALEPVVDDTNKIQYDSEVTPLYGVDMDFTVVNNEWVQVTPYTDFNLLFGDHTGFGYHLGVDAFLFLPADSGIDAKLEYRYLGDHYVPQYVDSLYEIQRVVYPAPSAYPPDQIPLTKRQSVDLTENAAHGYLAELGASILGYVRIVGTLSGSERDDENNLIIQLLVPALEMVKFGVLYTKSGFDDFVDAFDPDGALFQAYARVKIFGPLDFVAQFNRRWRLNTDETSEDYGTYETIDEWGAGFGVSFAF